MIDIMLEDGVRDAVDYHRPHRDRTEEAPDLFLSLHTSIDEDADDVARKGSFLNQLVNQFGRWILCQHPLGWRGFLGHTHSRLQIAVSGGKQKISRVLCIRRNGRQSLILATGYPAAYAGSMPSTLFLKAAKSFSSISISSASGSPSAAVSKIIRKARLLIIVRLVETTVALTERRDTLT